MNTVRAHDSVVLECSSVEASRLVSALNLAASAIRSKYSTVLTDRPDLAETLDSMQAEYTAMQRTIESTPAADEQPMHSGNYEDPLSAGELLLRYQALDEYGRGAVNAMLDMEYKRSTQTEQAFRRGMVDRCLDEQRHGIVSMFLYRLKHGEII